MSFQSLALYKSRMRILVVILPVLLSGCLARTAVDLVTLPVKVVGAGVDAATTSQAEADQRRGRQVREEEERLGREARRREREAERAREREEDVEAEAPENKY